MSKKDVLRMSDFRKSSACMFAQDHEALRFPNEETESGLTTEIVKDTIRLFFTQDLELSEVEDVIVGGYSGLTGIECGKAEEAQIKKIAKSIRRYMRSEKRAKNKDTKIIIAPHLEFSSDYFPALGEAFPLLELKPFSLDSIDVVIETNDCIEGIIFKSGYPFFTNSGKHRMENDLPSLMALQALKTLVPEGETKTVCLSYYYMKSKDDRKGTAWEYKNYFDCNLTSSLESEFKNTEAARNIFSDLDQKLIKMLESHDLGINKEECTEDDCRSCQMNCYCNFIPTPEAMEQKEVKKGKKITPSDIQRQVIEFDEKGGCMEVIAGAGSGKTETLSEHFVYILRKEIDQIMANSSVTKSEAAREALKTFMMTTFTNAGCNEMKDRIIGKLANEDIFVTQDDLAIMTFNTFAYNIDKMFYEELGFSKEPIVIDDIRQCKIIVRLLDEHTIDGIDYEAFFIDGKSAHGALACARKVFDIIKTEQIDPEAEGAAREIKTYLAGYYDSMSDQSIDQLIDLYIEYRNELLENGLITFADQEPMAIRILDAHPDLLDLEPFGFKHIMVDEFQDSNDIQMEFVKRLSNAKTFNEMVVVGDDFQAIYGFRKTSPDNMIHFEERLGKTVQQIYLVENYRSVPEVLALADAEIKNNKNQLPKQLSAARSSIGTKPVVKGFYDKDSEVDFVVDTIKEKLATGNYIPEDFCIITMTNAELNKFNAKLTKAGIPIVAKNPLKFSDNSRVKAALDLAQAFWEPDAKKLYWSYLCAKYNGKNLETMTDMEILDEIDALQDSFTHMEDLNINYQRKLFHEYLDALAGTDEIYQAFLDMLYACEDLPDELDFVQDFKRYGQDAAKRMEQSYQGVVLTTAHSSKGLEWKVVFNSISGYDNPFFHNKGRNNSTVEKELEERRRLLYVSMTRARDELFVTSQYVAYGSKEKGFEYNQFLHELYDITGEAYVPVDPELSQKEEAKKKAAAERAKRRREQNKILKENHEKFLKAISSAS